MKFPRQMCLLTSVAMILGLTGCDGCKEWSPEKDRMQVKQANQLMKSGEREKATKLLKSTINCREKNQDKPFKYRAEYEAYFLLGKLQTWDAKTRVDGIRNLERSLEINSSDSDVKVALANAYLWEGSDKSDENYLYMSRDAFRSISPSNSEQRDAVNGGLDKVDNALERVRAERDTNY